MDQKCARGLQVQQSANWCKQSICMYNEETLCSIWGNNPRALPSNLCSILSRGWMQKAANTFPFKGTAYFVLLYALESDKLQTLA
jgi:hypothetical protein